MRELNDIYSALVEARASNEALGTWVSHADAHDIVRHRERVINDGIKAYERLRDQLRDGQKHVEPPAAYMPKECYCSAPTCSPPCGFCTDPANNNEE